MELMKFRNFFLINILLLVQFEGLSQQSQILFPVQAFCIAAPSQDMLPPFLNFIEYELAPKGVNTLILRVDYNYSYESHPELRNDKTLSKENVKKIVNLCKEYNIRVIPQINLLGHQSWHSNLENLLSVYPEFDETPQITLPEIYEWPNEDSLYCKSYCPLHPEVHDIVFDLVDEICQVFEADAFHAGMDEVFYIGHEQCPRCAGKNKAKLFADEVTKIRNHLAENEIELWIWGDRLLDGTSTGMGMWEASINNTFPAIDMIPKDVVICDWHYERPDKTPVYFAMKGFRVITCTWRTPHVGVEQVRDMIQYRTDATPEMKERYLGMMQTIWTSAGNFMQQYYGPKVVEEKSQVETFHQIFERMKSID